MADTWIRSGQMPAQEPRAGIVFSIVLSMVSMGILAICMTSRIQSVRDWSRYPFVCWLVLLTYSDSITFVLGTAVVLAGYGVNSSKKMCENAILLCLACYMTTKVSRSLGVIVALIMSWISNTYTLIQALIYYFLVERAYIIRRPLKPRIKDPLYLFNSFGMPVPYCVVITLSFIFRFANYDKGQCRIGAKKVAMIPLIVFDVVVNVYLTSLFLIPLKGLYSYKHNPTSQTRTVALRTFIGSCCTLTSSVANLTLVMVLKGEPGWICLMCCNVDILFSVLVLHWITSKDNASTFSPNNSFANNFPPKANTSTSPRRFEPRSPHSEPGLRECMLYTQDSYPREPLATVTTTVIAGPEKLPREWRGNRDYLSRKRHYGRTRSRTRSNANGIRVADRRGRTEPEAATRKEEPESRFLKMEERETTTKCH